MSEISHYLFDDPTEYPFISLESLASEEDNMRRPVAASAYKAQYPSKFIDEETRMDRYVRDALAEGDHVRKITAGRRILEDRTHSDLMNAYRL